jgi:hypothetical protein
VLSRRLLIIPVVVALLFAVVADTAAGSPARIGGPPPFPVNELIPGLQLPEDRHFRSVRTGPEVLLGVGHKEQLEIVGYRSGKGACVDVANRQVRSSGGGCGGSRAFLPPSERSIFIDGVDGTEVGHDGTRFSQIEGSLSPDVTGVRLVYPLRGKMRQSRAVVARVRGHLLAAIGLKRPFGGFAATYHGCSSKVKVMALGEGGEVLESTSLLHGLLRLRVPCKEDGGASGAVANEPSGVGN